MKVTYKQMILIFIVVALGFFTINMFYPNEGPIVTMMVMISIFVAYKAYQYLKKED